MTILTIIKFPNARDVIIHPSAACWPRPRATPETALIRNNAACRILALLGAFLSAPAAPAQDTPALPTTGLAISGIGRYGRSPIHIDAVQARIARGEWKAPRPGDTLPKPDGSNAEWKEIKAGEDGSFNGEAFTAGYLFLTLDSPAERVMLLDAHGHGMVYVNGEPRVGDIYANGLTRLPILLRKGPNEFLFSAGRGNFAAKLTVPPKDVFIDQRDSTLPDLEVGRDTALASVLVVNCTATATPPLVVSNDEFSPAIPGGGARAARVPALSARKIAFEISGQNAVAGIERRIALNLHQIEPGQAIIQRLSLLDSVTIQLPIRGVDQGRRITFQCAVDGSIQYYSLVPPSALSVRNATPSGGGSPALLLSLHGAGVEAAGQAGSYAAKYGLAIAAPTNRRPFGFDWEDWGRLDAIEVLQIAANQLQIDPRRVYLSGHSMGGHGTWNIGVTYPDKFAAIGPSAGWLSFWTYGMGQRREPKNALDELLQRCTAGSDTPSLIRNLLHTGVYILHGDKDDNVPVEQARTARDLLKEFHHDFELFEQPGAGHWWDAGHDAGADCLDWQPMFDFFARHRLPTADEVSHVDFTTVNPGVSADCFWATIQQQQKSLKPSTIHLRRDAVIKHFVGTTENVAVMQIRLVGQSLPEAGKPVTFELDDQTGDNKLEWTPQADQTSVWLRRDGDGKWSASSDAPKPGEKSPQRNGPFKDAFRNHMMFVYGTKGTHEENALQANKARYDAETFWYRGNGSVDVIPDTDFDQKSNAHRNVILYGNADTVSCWKELVGESPVVPRRGSLRIGDRELKGDDLGLLLIRPRANDDDQSCVGIVTGTGPAGMRTVERLPYFLSGVAYPDCTVISADSLTKGIAGVRAAGFFGPDWSVEKGEFTWSESQAE